MTLDPAEKATDPGVGSGTASPSAGDPPPRWEPRRTPRQMPGMIGAVALPRWLILGMRYWWVWGPVLILLCCGGCGGVVWFVVRILDAFAAT